MLAIARWLRSWFGWCGFGGLLTLLLLLGTVRAETLRYPRHQAVNDPQLAYVLDVLRLAIRESGKPYRLAMTPEVMVQSRAIAQLALGKGDLDILWTMTSAEREARLLPIRFPIDRGLIGWRVMLVQRSRLAEFSAVNSLAELARFDAGQMHDWPDTTILRANGLRVETSPHYEGLFRMLAAQRIDYFPRSLIEVESELAAHLDQGLAIEPGLLLRYPTAFYFFVSRQRPELAMDLERGLRQAQANGKFLTLFYRHFGPTLKSLRVAQRRVLELNNPLLPEATPLSRPELWYRPGEAAAVRPH